MYENKLTMMIQGHEIWLEDSKAEKGGPELALVYGHNMRQDGVASRERLKAFAYNPDGTRSELDPIPDNNRYLLKLNVQKGGYYTAVVDLGSIILSQTKEGYEIGPRSQFKDVIYAGAFHQMAKYIYSAGSDGEFHDKVVHGILEIVPGKPRCQAGQDIELQVFYEGKPLASAEIKAVSKQEGKEMALVKTDEQGSAHVPVTVPGDWMFLVRHRDSSKKASEEFDESVFISTLVMVAR